MKHNNKIHQIVVSDNILADNITRETYETFRKLSVLRKEPVKCNDFNLCLSATDVSQGIEKLLESNISSYIDMFRRIKIWNAYLCMLNMVFSWSEYTDYNWSNVPIKEYVVDVTKYISSKTTGVIKRFSNKINEEMHFLSYYFNDLPFKLQFGMSIPIYPEFKIIKNTYLTVILFLILFIIFMIFLYYYKLKDI